MRMRAVSVSLATVLAATVVHAEPTPTDRNIAQSLFEQARQLADAGKFDEACPKFEESERLDPGGGTLLNLAFCHESQGKIATAWTDFKEALSAARRDARKDREDAAAERISALEPRLPHLTINVTGIAPGEGVTMDAAQFGRAGWGAALAVDPGIHVIAASAPGKQPFSTTLTIAEKETKAVSIPALVEGPSGASPAPPGAPPQAPPPDEGAAPPSSGKSNTAAWVIGGVSVVSLGVGSFFGVQALSKRHDSNAQCPTDATCTAEGVRLNDDAKTSAWVADFGVGLGVVGLGVASYLLLSGGSNTERAEVREATSVAFDAIAGPAGGAVRVKGAF